MPAATWSLVPDPLASRTRTGRILAPGATPATPIPLSLTAAAIPATCVPCPFWSWAPSCTHTGGFLPAPENAMERVPTRIDGPVLIKPVVKGDERGFFHETYRRSAYADLGIGDDFVQDNHSRSGRGVVRGMHFQVGMAKLVRCARGSV